MSVSVATSETSFVHAISAAGVMYTLTRNCSLGDLDNCGCDGSRNGQIGNAHNNERVDLKKVIIFLHPAMCAHTHVFACLLSQGGVGGCGAAAVITWTLGKGCQNSTWTRLRLARTHGRLSTFITTRPVDW